MRRAGESNGGVTARVTAKAVHSRGPSIHGVAGYVVSSAANEREAVAFTIRRLPDVVVMPVDAVNTFDVVARLAYGSSTHDIPVVVLTPSLHSADAHRASALDESRFEGVAGTFMDFRIADSFTDSLARLTSEERRGT